MRLERLYKSQVEEIYKTKMQEDFPADEIKPLKAILKGIDKGIYEPCGLFEDSELIGYAFFVKLGSDYLLDYLAVHSDMRNKGVGSTAVMLIADYLKEADNVVVEVEDPDYATDPAEKDLQTRRYNFYLRNGCTDTGLRVKCFGVPFRILRMGPQQKEDHDKLWKLYQEFYRVMLPKEMFEKNLSLNEYIDIFSRDGSVIKKSVPKHTPRLPGEYIQHVLVIMKTADSPDPGKGEGQYVVQQRSLKAKYYAGKWDMTGGGVKSGESPKEAACREVEEELSITVPPEDMELAFEYIKEWDDGTGLLASIFMCRVEVPKDGFKFNTYEVNDVKVMPFHEFLEHVRDHNDEEFCRGLEDIEKRL